MTVWLLGCSYGYRRHNKATVCGEQPEPPVAVQIELGGVAVQPGAGGGAAAGAGGVVVDVAGGHPATVVVGGAARQGWPVVPGTGRTL